MHMHLALTILQPVGQVEITCGVVYFLRSTICATRAIRKKIQNLKNIGLFQFSKHYVRYLRDYKSRLEMVMAI